MVFRYLLEVDKRELLLTIVDKIFEVLIIMVFGYLLIKIVDKILEKVFSKTKFDQTIEQFIQSLVWYSLWIVLLLIILKVIGVDTTPIIASLSIVGFVSGFALKDVLSNLAAGLMIIATKPFKVGDSIKTGDITGTIDKVRIASTSIRTFDNLRIMVPNATLWGNPITNYSRYNTRRMDIKVGVSYNEKIDRVIKVLNKILKKQKKVLENPSASFFVSELGNYTVNITLRCWTNKEDYFDTLISLNKDIKETFEKEKIEMPNPTMDIYMKK